MCYADLDKLLTPITTPCHSSNAQCVAAITVCNFDLVFKIVHEVLPSTTNTRVVAWVSSLSAHAALSGNSD